LFFAVPDYGVILQLLVRSDFFVIDKMISEFLFVQTSNSSYIKMSVRVQEFHVEIPPVDGTIDK